MPNERQLQEDLRRQLAASEERMKRCKHVFDKPIYDPKELLVDDDRAGYEEHGSDRWVRPSFHKEQKERWSRECMRCGHKEYTCTQEPVSTELKPKFN